LKLLAEELNAEFGVRNAEFGMGQGLLTSAATVSEDEFGFGGGDDAFVLANQGFVVEEFQAVIPRIDAV
jgi:hypothetical protein